MPPAAPVSSEPYGYEPDATPTPHAPSFFEWERSQAADAEADGGSGGGGSGGGGGGGDSGGGGGGGGDPLSDAVKEALQGQSVDDLQVHVEVRMFTHLIHFDEFSMNSVKCKCG